MEYDPDISIMEDENVYPPSDDSIFLIRCLDVKPGESVLEMGCGSGIVSLHCAKMGAKVTAGDINSAAVELTKRNALSNNLKVDVVLTNVYESISGTF
ncbi:MAG TPA: methyltransferase, partial [Candidatus Methanomethylophilaceae archaeon]|nr:methyltransferase [Candidatus Methanomethylophilaceae archaeon]